MLVPRLCRTMPLAAEHTAFSSPPPPLTGLPDVLSGKAPLEHLSLSHCPSLSNHALRGLRGGAAHSYDDDDYENGGEQAKKLTSLVSLDLSLLDVQVPRRSPCAFRSSRVSSFLSSWGLPLVSFAERRCRRTGLRSCWSTAPTCAP